MIKDEIEIQIKETIKKGQKPTLIMLDLKRWHEFQIESMPCPIGKLCIDNFHGIPVHLNFRLDADKIEIRSCDPRD